MSGYPETVMEVDRLRGGYIQQRGDTQVYVDAVSSVSFRVYRDEVLGIAGESGCGKSTLVKILYGLVKYPLIVREGSVFIDGGDGKIDLTKVDDDYKKRHIWWRIISYIPQNSMSVLNPLQKIKDHFAENLRIHMGIDKAQAYRRAVDYLLDMGLQEDVIDAYPHQLSGGMRQRVVIALALLMKPRVVLADEPTTGLDVIVQRGVLQNLLENQKRFKSSLVLVSHDIGIHAMVTNRLIIMYAGKLVEIGNTNDIISDPKHPYTEALIESLPKLGDKSLRKGLGGQPPDLRSPPKGCRFHPRCPFVMDICRSREPPPIEINGNRVVSCWLYK